MRKDILFVYLVLPLGAIIIGILAALFIRSNRITQAEEPSKEPIRGANQDKPQKGEIMSEITLPQPQTTGKMPLEEAIQKRKSVRKYASTELTIEQVSQILWSAYGQNPRKRFIGRTVPSAGAIYPISVHLLDKNGVYRYQSLNHSLTLVKKGDMRKELTSAALGQGFIQQAPIDLVITGDVAKCAKRYGDRALRYVAMEAGHIGQNVSLQAVSLGLDTVMVGAFNDDAVKDVISIPQEEAPLYIIPVGYAAE